MKVKVKVKGNGIISHHKNDVVAKYKLVCFVCMWMLSYRKGGGVETEISGEGIQIFVLAVSRIET